MTMEQSTARTIVNVVSILDYIGSGIAIIAGLAAILAGSSILGALSPALAALGAIFGIVVIIVGIFGIFVGYGLWHLKNWARIVTIIFSALGVLVSLVSLFSGSFGSGILSVIIDGAIVWFFGFEKEAVALFKNG